MSHKTKTITIELLRQQLLYDVASIAFVEGDILRTDDEHARHQIMDITQCGNVDQVSRFIELAYSECVEALYAFSKRDVPDFAHEDDVLTEREVFLLELTVPESFSETTHRRITLLMHEFIVARALGWWFGIAHPDKAAWWRATGDALLESLNKTKNMRSKIVLRKSHPWSHGL